MDIKVSVIMPSLNVVGYIEESIRSVMQQTINEIEIICVDAGSDDGTLSVIQELMSQDSRIVLINSCKKSYGYQVNEGIKIAKGEYIAIVETDDYVSKNMYEQLYGLAKQNNADIAKSDYYAYYTLKNGERFNLKRATCTDKPLYGVPFKGLEKIFISEDDWYLWTGIYKKSFLKKNNIFFHESAGAAFQDIGFIHKTNVNAQRIVYSQHCLYYYCIDRAESSSNSGKGLLFSCAEFKSLLDDYAQEDNPIVLKQLYLRMTKSLMCCLNDIDSVDVFKKQEYLDAYKWLRNQIKKAIDMNVINMNDMSVGLREKASIFLDSQETYIRYRKEQEAIIERSINGKNVIVFGCGNIGYAAYRWLKKSKHVITCFMDNNSDLWGKMIDETPIVDPKECTNYAEEFFVVANEKYYLEIVNQLCDNGISRDRIIIFK